MVLCLDEKVLILPVIKANFRITLHSLGNVVENVFFFRFSGAH